MQSDDVKKILEQSIENVNVDVRFEGNHAHVTVVGEVFRGLSPVKKQQLVYAVLNEYIASGQIHAVHIKTLTPDQVSVG